MADTPESPDTPSPDLLALREQIDALDLQVLALLNRRAELAQAVGHLKQLSAAPVFRPEREAQVIGLVQAANTGPLASPSLAPIWREIMSACRALEAPIRVAYLGPHGTFTEEASFAYFGSSIEGLPCVNIDEVFRATSSASADFGLVPIENSTEGMVGRTMDLFLTTPLHIIGETSLNVQHNLLRKVPHLDQLSAVCAHPQALAQCQAWLNLHLPHIERRPLSSNAQAAQLASHDASVAAIASTRAADYYGLHTVYPAIQDDANNRTRFAILADPQRQPAPRASGHDCTSVVVSLLNRPGAVYDLLEPLKRLGVSMSRLESRPARSGQWEYFFFIDLLGHPEDPRMQEALELWRHQCAFFKLLGAYPLAPTAAATVAAAAEH